MFPKIKKHFAKNSGNSPSGIYLTPCCLLTKARSNTCSYSRTQHMMNWMDIIISAAFSVQIQQL